MKYHFRIGRGKNIIVDEDVTFKELGLAILSEDQITPDHLFRFDFSNGDATDSACPFGPMNDRVGNISIRMKIKDRNMDVGEVMTFVYDFARDWSRKVKLVEILSEESKESGSASGDNGGMVQTADGTFSDRLKDLCSDYYDTYMEDPPMPVSSYTRMNSLLAGTRKPTMDELIAISEAFDVSINYLLVGDELFPSLRQLKKKDADRILEIIEGLKPEIEW